jgi:hypothetical protein
MSEEKAENVQAVLSYTITEPKDGVPRIYAAYSHITWSGVDLTVDLYHLEQPNREIPDLKDVPNSLYNVGRIVMSWAAAKQFHDLLGGVVDRYEAAYGPINTEYKQI